MLYIIELLLTWNEPSECCCRAEYSAFWKCVQAGVAYMLTQLCKMMILATFFPSSDLPEETFDIVGVRVVHIRILHG